MTVSSSQRFTRKRPCPICDGYDETSADRRCYGFLSSDRQYVRCTRAELAGPLSRNEKDDTYSHRVTGECGCGVTHQADEPSPRPGRTVGVSPQGIKRQWEQASADPGRLAAYLKLRGLDTPVPASLRFLADLPYFEKEDGDSKAEETGRFPAMLARFVTTDGRAVGIHRTYLDPVGAGKAAVARPKKFLGKLDGAAIHLQEPGDGSLAVVEGIETGLAVHQATGLAVWVAGSANGVAALELPRTLRRLEIWADADPHGKGQAKAQALALRAAKAGIDTYVIAPDEGDWLDVLTTQGAHQLRSAREQAKPWAARTVIVCDNRDLPEKTTETLDALERRNAVQPRLFVRSRELVRVGLDESKRPMIEPLAEAGLRGELARSASFVQESRQGVTKISPPLDIVRDIGALGQWPLPPLYGIVEAPVLRQDGSILSSEGYDPDSWLYYAPADDFEFPCPTRKPSQAEAIAALEVIEEAICDFPWADQASHANALALLLTPIVRHYVGAFRVPLAAIDSPVQGTGKGLLNDLVTLIATGRPAGLMSPVEDDAEWRKQITTKLLAGSTYMTIDNVVAPLDSAALSVAITADTWEDRLLGANRQVKLPIRVTWAATGNNIQLRGDLVRRAYWIRLDSKLADPSLRTTFRHPELLEWATQERGRLLAALLTMARAWHVAGCPRPEVPGFGSFGRWASVIGGILAYVGVDGFLANLRTFRQKSDQDRAQWELFLATWREQLDDREVSTHELAERIFSFTSPQLREVLPDVLAGAYDRANKGAEGTGSQSFRVKLGLALRSVEGRRFGDTGLSVIRSEDRHRQKPTWHVSYTSEEELHRVEAKSAPGWEASSGNSYSSAPGAPGYPPSTAHSGAPVGAHTRAPEDGDGLPQPGAPGASEFSPQDEQPQPGANGRHPTACPECGLGWSVTRPGESLRCLRGHPLAAEGQP